MMNKLLLAAAVCSLAQPARAAEPTLQFAFEEWVTLAAPITPGQTALGGRNIIPITGGHFAGPGADGKGIAGTILPGGWDWQLRRADGCTKIHADYMLKTDDGAVINVVNDGIACHKPEGNPPVRTHPVFEAPLGRYDWLSQGTFIGTLEPDKSADGTPSVHIRFYRVL